MVFRHAARSCLPTMCLQTSPYKLSTLSSMLIYTWGIADLACKTANASPRRTTIGDRRCTSGGGRVSALLHGLPMCLICLTLFANHRRSGLGLSSRRSGSYELRVCPGELSRLRPSASVYVAGFGETHFRLPYSTCGPPCPRWPSTFPQSSRATPTSANPPPASSNWKEVLEPAWSPISVLVLEDPPWARFRSRARIRAFGHSRRKVVAVFGRLCNDSSLPMIPNRIREDAKRL